MTSKALAAILVVILFTCSVLSGGGTAGAFTDSEELEVTVAGNVSIDEYEGNPPAVDAHGPPDNRGSPENRGPTDNRIRGPPDADTGDTPGVTATGDCGDDDRLENGTTDGAADTASNRCDRTTDDTEGETEINESDGAPENDTGTGNGEPNDGDIDAEGGESVTPIETNALTSTADAISGDLDHTEDTDPANSSGNESDTESTATANTAATGQQTEASWTRMALSKTKPSAETRCIPTEPRLPARAKTSPMRPAVIRTEPPPRGKPPTGDIGCTRKRSASGASLSSTNR